VKLRQDEELSANAFEAYLSQQRGCSVKRCAVLKDPPDLCFSVAQGTAEPERWAVEVTALTQYVERDGEEFGRRMFEPALHRLVERINLEHLHIMNGSYSLFVTGPLDARVFRGLESRIVDYIRAGKRERTALDGPEIEASILRDHCLERDSSDPLVRNVVEQLVRERVRVQIAGSVQGKGLGVMSMVSGIDSLPNKGGIVADIQASVNYSVDGIIAQKEPKMAPLTGYDRRYLLVWNDLPLARPDEVRKALEKYDFNSSCLDGAFFIDYGWKSVTLVGSRPTRDRLPES
jgi:hypothetical protein